MMKEHNWNVKKKKKERKKKYKKVPSTNFGVEEYYMN